MQRVTPGIELAFQPVEYELRNKFLPEIFKGEKSQIPGRAVTVMIVNQAGIALPDPT